MDSKLDKKLDYISRLFQKTSHKAIENYVITRLWHKLDDNRIKMLPQQYVNRHEDKYALTDVFFPQVKIHVEVNERAHYESEERILADALRKKEIEKQTGHRVCVIDCRKSLQEIHNDIEHIVEEIRNAVAEQERKGEFEPWNPDEEKTPEYWKKKGQISIKDEVMFDTTDKICKLFDTVAPPRKGGTPHPRKKLHIWWPNEKNKNFYNKLEDNDEKITEYCKDERKREKHIQDFLSNPVDRLTFFKYKDVLGFSGYKFKGVYELDKNETLSKNALVWKRISTEFQL